MSVKRHDKSQEIAEQALLFITYEYPFGSSETFVTAELERLSSAFETVFVFPVRSVLGPSWYKDARIHQRKVPTNCSLLVPRRSSLGLLRLVSAVAYLPQVLRKLDYSGLLNEPSFGRLRWSLEESCKAALVLSAIGFHDLGKKRRVVGYSYWKNCGATALAVLRKKGVIDRAMVRCHGGDLYLERNPHKFFPYDTFVAQTVDDIAPVSESGRRALLRYGFSAHKVQIGRLGVEVGEVCRRASRDGVLRLVSCSNLIPLKRVNAIAMALLNAKFPFHWVHFGDGPEKSAIMEISSRFPCHGSFEFPGRVSNDDIVRYYRDVPVDVFVNVSETEGIPVSIMEAFSAGIPCIATDVGGTSELVDDSCGTLLHVDFEPFQLLAVLQTINQHQDVWIAKGMAAKEKVLSKFNEEKNYTEMARRLLAEERPA